MGKFVATERVPVRDEEGNTIWIRAKMDLGTVGKVNAYAIQTIVSAGAQIDDETTVSVGAYQTALMLFNIVDWEGPDFLDDRGRKILCNPSQIAKLDPEDALVQAALHEVGLRNKRRVSPDPKSPHTVNGSMSAGATDLSTPA